MLESIMTGMIKRFKIKKQASCNYFIFVVYQLISGKPKKNVKTELSRYSKHQK